MESEIMPSPYDEGVDLGRALCRDGVPLIRVRLTAAAASFGYAGEMARRWKQGVIAGYAREMEARHGTRDDQARP